MDRPGLLHWFPVGGLTVASAILVAAGCTREDNTPLQQGQTLDRVASFLEAHWASPRKGHASAAASAAHSDLDPASCGTCHKAQYDDWRGSLHARTMGPGVLGQLVSMSDGERHECQRCHAPLDEQADPRSPLFSQGLICAACHVRGGRVFGPARRDGSSPAPNSGAAHGGGTASSAFEDSRFCAICHQFEPDGYALNGKLLENTYEEWKASVHAREGRNCQSCHMPGRRHLWRGIHDPAMTRAAIAVRMERILAGAGEIQASWRLGNVGAGHYFPTYVTPRVIVAIWQEAADGRMLPGTLREQLIARQVTLDLGEELSDTRLAPGEERAFEYKAQHHARATHLALEIRVEPDAFYTELYRSLLKDGSGARAQIGQALRESLASRYTAYNERQALR